MIRTLGLAAASAFALAACGGMMRDGSFSQSALPAPIQVPAGHKVSMETVGVGELTYECREKQGAAAFEWAFVGPQAALKDRSGRTVGKYYGPPATWEGNDGSKVTGTQLAVSPAEPGSIPLQLVRANPPSGRGAMGNVAYIQRVATRGGAAPSAPCAAANKGARQVVPYQADYIFWSAG